MKKLVPASLAATYLVVTAVVLALVMISLFGLVLKNSDQESEQQVAVAVHY